MIWHRVHMKRHLSRWRAGSERTHERTFPFLSFFFFSSIVVSMYMYIRLSIYIYLRWLACEINVNLFILVLSICRFLSHFLLKNPFLTILSIRSTLSFWTETEDRRGHQSTDISEWENHVSVEGRNSFFLLSERVMSKERENVSDGTERVNPLLTKPPPPRNRRPGVFYYVPV